MVADTPRVKPPGPDLLQRNIPRPVRPTATPSDSRQSAADPTRALIHSGAFEIDFFETTASSSGGEASQSAQWAPMNRSSDLTQTFAEPPLTLSPSANYYIVNSSTTNVEYGVEGDWDTKMNTYLGGAYQMVRALVPAPRSSLTHTQMQSTSALSKTNASTYDSETEFCTFATATGMLARHGSSILPSAAVFGVDYTPTYISGPGTGVIYWINQGMSGSCDSLHRPAGPTKRLP